MYGIAGHCSRFAGLALREELDAGHVAVVERVDVEGPDLDLDPAASPPGALMKGEQDTVAADLSDVLDFDLHPFPRVEPIVEGLTNPVRSVIRLCAGGIGPLGQLHGRVGVGDEGVEVAAVEIVDVSAHGRDVLRITHWTCPPWSSGP